MQDTYEVHDLEEEMVQAVVEQSKVQYSDTTCVERYTQYLNCYELFVLIILFIYS